MIYSLPPSLIQESHNLLVKTRYPSALVSFKDVDSDESIDLHENTEGYPHIDEWLSKKDNTRQSINSLNLDQTHTDDDKTHVYRYTASSSSLNRNLFKTHKDNKQVNDTHDIDNEMYHFTHDIKGLDAAINRNKLNHDLTTYSGISWDPSKKFNGDDTHIHLPAYTSTTTDKYTAHRFAVTNKKPDAKNLHILKILNPAGSRGLYTHDDPVITHYVGESEFISPRGITIHVNPTPETYHDEHNNTVHVWSAYRKPEHEKSVDTNYITKNGRTEIYNKDNLKIYRTDTLSALKKHYPQFHQDELDGNEFHQNHVFHPIFHIHTPDGGVYQTINDVNDSVISPRNKHGQIRSDINKFITKYPQISHLSHLFKRNIEEK